MSSGASRAMRGFRPVGYETDRRSAAASSAISRRFAANREAAIDSFIQLSTRLEIKVDGCRKKTALKKSSGAA